MFGRQGQKGSPWYKDVALFVGIFLALVILRPDVEITEMLTRYFVGSLFVAACGLGISILFPKAALEKRWISSGIISLGGVVAALIGVLWGIAVSVLAFAIAVAVLRRLSHKPE
jgi:hypothetical protein